MEYPKRNSKEAYQPGHGQHQAMLQGVNATRHCQQEQLKQGPVGPWWPHKQRRLLLLMRLMMMKMRVRNTFNLSLTLVFNMLLHLSPLLQFKLFQLPLVFKLQFPLTHSLISIRDLQSLCYRNLHLIHAVEQGHGEFEHAFLVQVSRRWGRGSLFAFPLNLMLQLSLLAFRDPGSTRNT